MKKNIINVVVTLIIGFVIYYFTLPSINIHSAGFYIFLIFLLLIFLLLSNISNFVFNNNMCHTKIYEWIYNIYR